MSKAISASLTRLGWSIPAVVAIAVSCSDATPGSDRTPSGGTGTGSNPTGVTAGTGTMSTTGTGVGPTGGPATTTSGAGGAGGDNGSVSSTTGMPSTTGAAGSGVGGATGTGGAPSDGGGIIVSDGGGKFGDTACGAGVTPMGIGRCANAPKYIVAKGTAITIANFEDLGPNNDHNTIFFGDGRSGNFIDLHAQTTGAAITMTIAQTPGIAAGASTWALHYAGTATGGAGPMFAIPVADCYDSRAYKGVSFWIRGNPAAGNDHLKFQVHTPIAQPAPSGGCSAADAAAHKCDDHYAVYVPITAQWTKATVRWSDLRQNCPSIVPAGYNPAQYNEMFSWALPKANAGFDVWFDNFTFDTGDLPTNTLADIVSEPTFTEMWSLAKADGTFTNLRNPFYTYQGMLAAVAGFPGLATTGDAVARRIEAAAFFSNVAHETDQLGIVEEKGCEGDHTCTQYGGTSPSGLTYHGRGPIQLTWPANYTSASNALGLGTTLVSNPELVATDPAVAWKTGFWFWMRGLSGGGTTAHDAINGGQGLGATIRVINGIECGSPSAPSLPVQNRLRHFRRFSYMFGLDPGAAANGC